MLSSSGKPRYIGTSWHHIKYKRCPRHSVPLRTKIQGYIHSSNTQLAARRTCPSRSPQAMEGLSLRKDGLVHSPGGDQTGRFVRTPPSPSGRTTNMYPSFFTNMAPYTPIITDFYAHHANHYWLITQEPTLCCVILLISSRHSVLSNAGGSSREQSIHNRLWQHCQHLILRIMLGQEKLSKAKTRNIGSIEALMLLAEWYPRALHFPPENDGWDSDLILAVPDERDPPLPMEETVMLKERWREDVVEPARRADRMAWMVLSSALALSHELGIFRSTTENVPLTKDTSLGRTSTNGLQLGDSNLESVAKTASGPDAELYLEHLERRKRRLPPLLFVFVNQLASRIGCTSPMAVDLGAEVWARLINSAENREWVAFMASWVELTRLTMGIINQYFPLASTAGDQPQGDAASLGQWRAGLARWQDRRPRLSGNVPTETSINYIQ